MYKVKLTIAPSDKGCNRQLPHSGFVWKDCEFHINEDIPEADFWVVCYQRLPNGKETCKVAPENTLFVTWEPDSVWHFSKGFLNQFGKVISCQEHLLHKNIVKDQPGLAWHIGKVRRDGVNTYSKIYDDFASMSPTKTKLISVISSNKAFTKGHRERMEFVHKLKTHFGDDMDVFGRGINDFDDKWNVIAPYKYHICLENCAQPFYWSEKLADSFLGEAFPFYYGCTNIIDFFPKQSFRAIDIHKADEAIAIIEESIKDGLAEKHIKDIQVAKKQVLDEYNFFELIHKHIQSMNPEATKTLVVIKDDLSFFDFHKYLSFVKRLFGKNCYRIMHH